MIKSNLKYHLKYTTLIGLAVLMMVSGFSCKKDSVLDCFISTGKIISVEREVGDFNSILLKDNVNLYLRQSYQNKIVLEAGENLMKKIVTEINADSVLEIRNDNSCNWIRSYDKPINIHLDFVRLGSLEYRSIGTVTNEDTLRMDSLAINVYEGAGTIDLKVNAQKLTTNLHYGTADIITSGNTVLSFVYLLGAGKIDNRSMVASQVYLSNLSSNNIFINATNKIAAQIEGIGNVYYYGNPAEIAVSGSGTGELIKLD